MTHQTSTIADVLYRHTEKYISAFLAIFSLIIVKSLKSLLIRVQYPVMPESLLFPIFFLSFFCYFNGFLTSTIPIFPLFFRSFEKMAQKNLDVMSMVEGRP